MNNPPLNNLPPAPTGLPSPEPVTTPDLISVKAADFHLPQLQLPSTRTIATTVVGLTLTLGLMGYFGGFGSVTKFFGANASLSQSITLTGRQNLLGQDNSDKPQWLVAMSEPVSNGTGVFDYFSGVPNPEALDNYKPGFVLPLVSSLDPAENTITTNTYLTPTIDLGSADITLKSVSFTGYTPASTELGFSYRTAESEEALAQASLVPLDTASKENSQDDRLTDYTAALELPAARYIQLSVNFIQFDASLGERPALYNFHINFVGSEIIGTTETSDMSEDNTALERTISLQYTGTDLPNNAKIQLFAQQEPGKVLYTVSELDLSQRLSYSFKSVIKPGAYALLVTSIGYQPKVIVFQVEGVDLEVLADGGTFTTAPEDLLSRADMNGDGVINSIDVNLLLQQYGPVSLPEIVEDQNP